MTDEGAPKRRGDAAEEKYTSHAYWRGLIKMSLSKFFVLRALVMRPMHGYEITKEVEKITQGCCSPTPGALYPVLKEFEEGGYVEAATEVVRGRQRKVYTITEKGRRAFEVAVESWMEITATIEACGKEGCPPGCC